jgi:UDP-N-acetylglucosamine transferase subunit ALG13
MAQLAEILQKGSLRRSVDMIFITVGTHTQQFNRLLEKIDELVENGTIKEKVVAQVGYSTYKPKNYPFFKFAEEEKIQELFKNSKLIITHAGAGSIITGLIQKKPLIVVPRLAKFDEHVNDHQLEIARAFQLQHKVLVCRDIENLPKMINRGFKFKPKLSSKPILMFKIMQRFLSNLE